MTERARTHPLGAGHSGNLLLDVSVRLSPTTERAELLHTIHTTEHHAMDHSVTTHLIDPLEPKFEISLQPRPLPYHDDLLQLV
jgi:hypothetical protein